MGPEHFLITVVHPGRSSALAIGTGIAPSIQHGAGFVVDDIEFTEISGIQEDLIGFRDIFHRVEMSPVVIRVISPYRIGQLVIDVELMRTCS